MRVFLALIAVCVNLRWVLSFDILSTVWHCCCCCRPWCCQYCCCCCCACCYCFCCVLKVHCLRIKHMKMLRICRTALSFAAAIKLPCSAVSATPHAWYCCCCMYVYYANFKFGFRRRRRRRKISASSAQILRSTRPSLFLFCGSTRYLEFCVNALSV